MSHPHHKKKSPFVKAHDADETAADHATPSANPATSTSTEKTMNAQTSTTSSTNSKSSSQSANSNNTAGAAQNAYNTAQNAYTNAFQQATSAFQNAFSGTSNPFTSMMNNTNGQNPFASMPGMPSAEQIAEAVRANGDALVRSAQTMTQGINQLTQAATQYTQNVLQMAVAATQAATSARTLREITDLQNDYAKTSFDALVENSTRMSELSLKIANDAAQPLSQRLNETMQQFQQQGSSNQSRAA